MGRCSTLLAFPPIDKSLAASSKATGGIKKQSRTTDNRGQGGFEVVESVGHGGALRVAAPQTCGVRAQAASTILC